MTAVLRTSRKRSRNLRAVLLAVVVAIPAQGAGARADRAAHTAGRGRDPSWSGLIAYAEKESGRLIIMN